MITEGLEQHPMKEIASALAGRMKKRKSTKAAKPNKPLSKTEYKERMNPVGKPGSNGCNWTAFRSVDALDARSFKQYWQGGSMFPAPMSYEQYRSMWFNMQMIIDDIKISRQ